MTSARFWTLASALLVLMAALSLWVESGESVTWDEPIHIAAGFEAWKVRDYTFNLEHPPLAKIIAAFPLWATRVKLPEGPLPHDSWQGLDWGLKLIHNSKYSHYTIVLLARLPILSMTLALGVLIAWFCRLRFGPWPAIAALALFVFDPGFLSHGHYVTTDVPLALGMFAACAFWSLYVERRGWKWMTLTAAALGFALSVKFSGILLVGILPLQALFQTTPWRFWHWREWDLHWWKGLLVAYVGAVAMILLVYAPDGLRLPGPKHLWWKGFEMVLDHNKEGHVTYLRGTLGKFGSWQYFPVAIGVKTTLGLLAAALLSLVVLRRRIPVVLWLAPAVVLAAAMTSNLNLGLRHVIQIYPFLMAITAAAMSRAGRRVQWTLALLVVAHCAESAAALPNPIGFFNLAAGGPSRGHEWLLDSNLDWGQDLRKLPGWLDRHGYGRHVCIEYFGNGSTVAEGISGVGLAQTRHILAGDQPDCIGVISATVLHDMYMEPGAYKWLRERKKPIAIVGSSLWIYDLRRTVPPRAWP